MKNLIILLLMVSCSDSNFRKVEELKGFRILGVIASAPEVTPGQSSSLQLIVSDPNGGGRSISGTTQSCIDPGIALGASVSCDHDPDTVTGTYTIDTANDADLGQADLYTGLATQSLAVTVPSTIFVGRSARDQFNGVGYITIFKFTVDGEEVSTFKRIMVSNRGSLNTNPTITGLLLDGSPMTARPQKDSRLNMTANSPETYNFRNIDGSEEMRAEEFALAWYVSSGELNIPKSEVGEEVKYLSNPATGTFVVLVVLRDERGGVSFEKLVLP